MKDYDVKFIKQTILASLFVATSYTSASADLFNQTGINGDNLNRVMAIERLYEQYRTRQLNVMEQTFNYQTTGKMNGLREEVSDLFGTTVVATEFWVSGHNGSHRCVMTRFSASRVESEVVHLGPRSYQNASVALALELSRAFRGVQRINTYVSRSPQFDHIAQNRARSYLDQLAIIGITYRVLIGSNGMFADNRIEYPADQVVDIREINLTGFRVTHRSALVPDANLQFMMDFASTDVHWVAGDETIRIETLLEQADGPDVQRLRNAWLETFRECRPHVSRF